MELKEMGVVLDILKSNYPATYKNMSEKEMKSLGLLWAEMFKEYEKPIVLTALKNYIKTNKYPPNIAGLQEQIDLLQPQAYSDIELWRIVEQFIRKSPYTTKEQFDELPQPIKIYFGDLKSLRNLAWMDLREFQNQQARFLKNIGVVKAREKVQSQMPQEVKDLIGGKNATRFIK